MNRPLAGLARTALLWKVVELGGVKAISLARILILGRALAPADFGLFAIAVLTLDFLLSVTEMGTVPALVQRREAEPGHYDAAWTLGLLRGVLIGVGVFAAAPLIAELFEEPRATPLIRMLALRPVIEGAASIRLAELTRQLSFRPLAGVQMSATVVNTVVSLVLVRPYGVWALVAGPIAGALTHLLASYLLAPYRPRISLQSEVVRSLFSYGGWVAVRGWAATAGGLLLQLALSRRAGPAELGLYFLSTRLAFLPGELASEVVGGVAFPLYARLQGDAQRAVRAFQTVLAGMVAVVVPSALLFVALAPALVQHILGPRWEGTAPVIQLLALVNIAGLLGDSIMPVYYGFGRPKWAASVTLLRAGLLVALAWALAARLGAVGAAISWLASAAAAQILAVLLLRRMLPQPFAGFAPVAMALTVAAITGTVATWTVVRLDLGIAGIPLGAAVGMAVTVLVATALERRYRLGLSSSLMQLLPSWVGGLVAWWSRRSAVSDDRSPPDARANISGDGRKVEKP